MMVFITLVVIITIAWPIAEEHGGGLEDPASLKSKMTQRGRGNDLSTFTRCMIIRLPEKVSYPRLVTYHKAGRLRLSIMMLINQERLC